LTISKRRPAIVISKTISAKNDIIVAFISSVIQNELTETDILLEPIHRDFKKSGLKKIGY
jgi:hypothetical protein